LEYGVNDSDFVFFQDHSRNYLEMALKTDKQELMENPDGYGKRTGVCGDTVEIYLKVRQKRVEAVSYHVDGCVNTNAHCAELAVGALYLALSRYKELDRNPWKKGYGKSF
jgi:nitrogen fixation NifU-like protein